MDEVASFSSLDQCILAAQNLNLEDTIIFIQNVLQNPLINAFGEILNLPSVKKVSEGPFMKYYELLQIFSYGDYADFAERRQSLPELTEAMKHKLRILTIVEHASHMKVIPYSLLITQLELSSVRELEDILIEALHAELIQGKLDTQCQRIEIEAAQGRDVKNSDLMFMEDTLKNWCDVCEKMLVSLDEEKTSSDMQKQKYLHSRSQINAQALHNKSVTLREADVEREQMRADVRVRARRGGKYHF